MSTRPKSPIARGLASVDRSGTPVQVHPVRAAFGPHVSLVSVDDQGHLWVRFSTAVAVMIAGLALLTIPALALWWIGGGLMDSGQVDLDPDQPGHHEVIVPEDSDPVPTRLPRADKDD